MLEYVLVTAARNEELYIEKPLEAVVSQTVLPKRWIIVSDGSTDRTDEIVKCYADKYEFIELRTAVSDTARNFGSKANAFKHGYEQLGTIDYDLVGNVDADISFDPTYYQEIIQEFQQNQKLGVAGGVRYDLIDGKFQKLPSSHNSVGGPYQLFRKQCYKDIGGYLPLEYGGIDAVAEISARMLGWEVRAFPEKKIYHYRPTGGATKNISRASFRAGVRDYLIGYHPLFQMMKFSRRILENPLSPRRYLMVAYGIYGYLFAGLKRYKRPVSDEFVNYLRTEQMARLRSIFLKGKDTVVRA